MLLPEGSLEFAVVAVGFFHYAEEGSGGQFPPSGGQFPPMESNAGHGPCSGISSVVNVVEPAG
eukprot:2763923-Pyramimonas_sp.AAC.1